MQPLPPPTNKDMAVIAQWSSLDVLKVVDEHEAHGVSVPKLTLVDGLRYVKETNQPFFRFRLFATMSQTSRFINCMRSHLSRLRNELRHVGKAPQQFAIYVHDIEIIDATTNECIITMAKDKRPIVESQASKFSELLTQKEANEINVQNAVILLKRFAPHLLKEQQQ